ncbi:MAG: UDP-N-acetylmuramoyl-tripeptide--D-alanyl-D-alanine ligase [Oscillospiraceae bacterium]|nr:UDP-N-acetylmuramoyl-tripeptide--D-alanyl-D-alanine ligase [Oscillospiraceae bacterium]
MEVILFGLFALAPLCGTASAIRYYLHMFQLNSYVPDTQRRWLAQNRRRRRLLLIPIAGGFLFWQSKAKKKLVKKPLVYTARVKRMIASIVFLQLLFTAIWWLVFTFSIVLTGVDNFFAAYVIWASPMLGACLLQILVPWTVLLANAVNAPIERAIRKHYINEAKEKLENSPNLIVIGITGSYGKTSVKHFLHTLLRAKFNVLMTPGGANVPMSVVRTIREELNASHEIFICEMGAKNVGDIKELCDIVHPRHGILTSIGPQHLETFGSQQNVIKTKFELADALPPEGILFANGDDENIRTKLHKYANVITYSPFENGSSYFAEDIVADHRGTTFTFVTPQGERESFTSKLIGRHNVVNLVGAAAAAHTLGVPLRALKGQMRKIVPVRHRLELLDHGGGLLVIDDAYNSNPTGAKAALDALALFEGTKILVTPGMVELGPRQEELNRAFGAQAAAICDFIALVGAAQTRPIREGVLSAGFDPAKLIIEEDLSAALAKVYALPFDGRKIILLENDLPDTY